MVKNKKNSPLTVIFLKLKDQKCLFQFDFSFLHLASNGINRGVQKLILILNFHCWMNIEWTKGTRTTKEQLPNSESKN